MQAGGALISDGYNLHNWYNQHNCFKYWSFRRQGIGDKGAWHRRRRQESRTWACELNESF